MEIFPWKLGLELYYEYLQALGWQTGDQRWNEKGTV